MKAKTKLATAQPSLMIDSEVVRQIRQHARSSSQAEVCGVLIGQDRDLRVEVTACIQGQNAEEAGAHVTFTQDTWEHIYAVKDKKYPGERIVGWYHSHPGFGIFLSEHDVFIQQHFFSSPGQVAWVFDPHSDEEGCFGWVNGQVERFTRITTLDRRGGEVMTARSEPEADAAPAHDPVTHETKKDPEAVRVRRVEVEEPDPDRGGVSLEQLVTKVFFSLALLLLGGLLSWYLFPHIVVMPIAVDPITGRPLDPQAEQILEEMEKNRGGGAAAQSGTTKPDASSAVDAGSKKEDDGKSK